LVSEKKKARKAAKQSGIPKAADPKRRKRGLKWFNEVYGGVVPVPQGELFDDFVTNVMDNLFADVWSRPGLSVRDRRLVIMGVLAALGEGDTLGIQVRASLAKQELTAQQIRELLILLTQYIGFPRAQRIRVPAEAALKEMGH
jgi:4-carboxymuconolactone decarboxylase